MLAYAKEKGMKERYRKTAWKNGKKEEKIKIAKKMIKLGMDIETICEVTGLTKEEIEKL